VKLYIDDTRCLPEGYDILARTYDAAQAILITGRVTEVSFDHDLGDPHPMKNGYELAKWMVCQVMNGRMKLPACRVHSANPVGAENIRKYLIGYEKNFSEGEG